MIILGLNSFHGDSAAALIRDGKLVEGMWLISQQDTPEDYVLATGESYSVREFVKAFAHVGRIITWRGRGVEEKGVDKATDQVLVEVEQARAKLGWRHKKSFDTLVADMVEADRITIRDERERRNHHG